MVTCEHDLRRGPCTELDGGVQTVCIKCWKTGTAAWFEGLLIEPWTEDLYWEYLDAIEGERAPEIRRMREEGRL